MNTELAKKQVCVLVRSGLELWIDADNVHALEEAMSDTTKRFIKIHGQLVNPFEILGVFTADAMDERQRRKNGQWRCMQGSWHEKHTQCTCSKYVKTITGHVEGVGPITYKR